MELTGEDLNFFSEFERIVRVMPRDYYLSDSLLVFLVDLKYLGKAIGKKGSNIPKLRSVFRKNVVILGDSPDPEIFLGSMFNNVKIFSIEVLDVMNEKNIIFTVDEKDRGIAIGKNGERIKSAKEFLKRKFNAKLILKTKRVLSFESSQ
ncbi:MAG TPA: NusA-like transcription termination signal-binding factor [Candidatus Bilamarchaeaceae archaeon]|nr:NusA-like transcription termination signal-binding factor [Candidatus Bilamarchaeaceae archaeon]